MSELGRVVVQRVIESPEQMAEFGRALSRVLHAGDVVLLEGAMGAGKTTLTRAVAVGLGHEAGLVSSPTFVLMNQYQSPGAMALAHIDAYRMSEDEELGTLGIDRVIVREDQEVVGEPWVVMIEWPGRIARALGQMLAGVSVVRVELEVSAETERIVTIDAPIGFAQRPGWGVVCGKIGEAICPVTRQRVPETSPTWPFANERAQMADLHRWMSGEYLISRPIRIEQD